MARPILLRTIKTALALVGVFLAAVSGVQASSPALGSITLRGATSPVRDATLIFSGGRLTDAKEIPLLLARVPP